MRPSRINALALLFLTTPVAAGVVEQHIFSGELARNLTVNAPLCVSTAGTVISCPVTPAPITATASTTTASATDVLMTSMTETPAAGTYYVAFHTSFTHSANNATITYTIYAGGTAVTGTAMVAEPTIQGGLTPSLPFSQPASVSGVVTVNGSQAVEIRWKTSAATATAGARIMNLVKVP